MSEEFKPITFETKEEYQEAIDSVLKDRLGRQKEKHARELSELSEKYKDHEELTQKNNDYIQQIANMQALLDEANEKVSGYDSQIAERDAQIDMFKMSILKNNIAMSYGLAPELAERLSGTTEEEIRKDAEKLLSIVGKSHRVAPLANGVNANVDDGVISAFKKLNPNINL